MSGIFSQENQITQAAAPVDINTAGVASDWLSMANYDRITFIISIGTHGGASTITVANASTNTGTGTADIAFRYRKTATTLVDDWGALTAVAATGVATDGATTNIMYLVEVDSQELTDGMDFVQVKMSDPGVATVVGVIGIGSRGKIKQATPISLQS
ncbi:MAG: hypothetical protein OEY10_00460 [Nitrosopumilus sp.]|nr:hypothetical protein [Nitrosopumilus sp.]